MIKKYDEYIKESLGYTSFFGKEVSHKDALKKRIRDLVTQIIVDELDISEKDFSRYDQVMEDVKDICDNNTEIYTDAENFYNTGKRLEMYAETIYDKYFVNKIDERLSYEELRTDVKGKVERSKKLGDMKDKILPLVTNNSQYNNGRVFDLSGFSKYGCSLGADKNGFFCYTDRARSKSYPEVDKIPKSKINFIESTG